MELLGELLDQLLVLVESLQAISVLEFVTQLSSLLAVSSISQHTDTHLGARNAGQLDGAGETLVLLGIVVLETNLQFDGLSETTLLLCRRILDGLDALPHVIAGNLTHGCKLLWFTVFPC